MKEDERLAPLIAELHRFCSAVERGDAQATDRMIAGVEGLWPDIPSVKLKAVEEDRLPHPRAEAGGDLLEVIADVGGVAEALLAGGHPTPTLAWCRANLIVDLQRFEASGAEVAS